MYDYIIYTDNSLKYTISGIDIHNAIEDNLHIIKHICGSRTDILSWEIEENTFNPHNEFNTYIIKVKYKLKTSTYTKVDNNIRLIIMYAEEHLHVNMPWEIMRL